MYTTPPGDQSSAHSNHTKDPNPASTALKLDGRPILGIQAHLRAPSLSPDTASQRLSNLTSFWPPSFGLVLGCSLARTLQESLGQTFCLQIVLYHEYSNAEESPGVQNPALFTLTLSCF